MGIRALTLPCDGKVDPRFARCFRQLVRNERVSLVHSHGYKENFHAILAQAGSPLVATNHLWKQGTTALRLYNWIDGIVLRSFDRVVAVSDPVLSDMRSAGIPMDKLCRISNGIDVDMYSAVRTPEERAKMRETLGLPQHGFIAGMVSSLTPEKGHQFAIAAVNALREKHPNLYLCIVGDGYLFRELRADVAANNLEKRILFAGRRSDIADVLSCFDAFLLPSLVEGLPMALLEAMAARLPIIAADVGDVSRAIESGISGIIIPAGSVDSLIRALDMLLTDVGLGQMLGEAARMQVNNNFSSRAMAKAYCQLYDELLENLAIA